ncbi:MAG: hypothetical protein IPP07_27780 [Holophagales bacterium]|nr:hypothetical protein [Holophagales bacterium]MBK9968457.1 hypothetical protein [Holophagales bacterium]
MNQLRKHTALLIVLLLPVLLPMLGLLLALSEPGSHLATIVRSLLLWPGDFVMFFLSASYLFKPKALLLKEGATAVLCLPWYCVLILPLALFVRRRWPAALVLFVVLAALHLCIGGILGVVTWGLQHSDYRF